MISESKNISNFKKSILVILAILILAICFETFQQLYYIKRFNLATEVSFFELLKTQTLNWFIWLLVSIILVTYIKSNLLHKKPTTLFFVKHTILIISLVFLSILIISATRLFISGDSFSITLLFKEYIQFFIFQKAPIYTLGYIAISIILHLFFINEQLQIDVQELSELKLTNARLFKKMNSTIDEKTTVLNIKIGNKRKIIPVEKIRWIEADDYCVKVHTISNGSYTMRSSLKALEEKLSTNFLRVHRKAIVNMTFARELHISGSPNLILENDMQIPISKSNLKTVKDFLN